MWELLQKLEDLGWKPYGKSIAELTETEKNVRLLTSLSSGLWQFVCENKMVRLDTDSGESDSYLCYYNIDGYPKDDRFEMERDDYRFRLIESALKDESELESFILDNIKV